MAAAVLALTLLAAGCAKPEQKPSNETAGSRSVQAEEERLAPDPEQLDLQKVAGEKLEGCLWPRETVRKDVLGREVEFVLYHGNGWTIHVPASWEGESVYAGLWSSPSHTAGFEVSKQFWGVNNPKHYRAQMGSWRHETSYEPPFDYYYDDDGGYTPPEGCADYIYFFAPGVGKQSYEFTLSTVVGRTSQEERAIQEAMLLSFSLDDSSHVLYDEDYTPGQTEWEAAMAGLAAEAEPILFFWARDGIAYDVDGKGDPDYLPFALAVADFQPGEFVQSFFGERPEGAPAPGAEGEMITLYLPEMGIWLDFYDGSPWVQLSHAREEYWAELRHEDDRDKLSFDTVAQWREAELGWADASAGI